MNKNCRKATNPKWGIKRAWQKNGKVRKVFQNINYNYFLIKKNVLSWTSYFVKNKKQKKSFEIFRRIMRFQLLNHKLNITVEKLEATFRKRLKKKRKEIIKICKTLFRQWNWQRGTALYWPTQFTDRWTYHVHDAKVRQKLDSAPLSVEKI